MKSKINYRENGIHNCYFCGSYKTKLSYINNNNPGRSGVMISVLCNSCYARGPKVTYFDRDNDKFAIDKIEKEAIQLWNSLALDLEGNSK